MSKSTPEHFNALVEKYGKHGKVYIGQILRQLDEIHDMAAKLAARAEKAETELDRREAIVEALRQLRKDAEAVCDRLDTPSADYCRRSIRQADQILDAALGHTDRSR